MTNQSPVLCAVPYNMDNECFYFSTLEEYNSKYKAHLPTEEYELQFIDGSTDEKFFAKYLTKQHINVEKFFELIDKNFDEKELATIYYLTEYDCLDLEKALDTMEEVPVLEGDEEQYARDFMDDTGELDSIGNYANYFDYKAFGRDLIYGGDIFKFKFNNITYVAQCNSY